MSTNVPGGACSGVLALLLKVSSAASSTISKTCVLLSPYVVLPAQSTNARTSPAGSESMKEAEAGLAGIDASTARALLPHWLSPSHELCRSVWHMAPTLKRWETDIRVAAMDDQAAASALPSSVLDNS